MTIDNIKRWLRAKGVGIVAIVGLLASASPAFAFVTTYPQDATLHMTTINVDLVIVAGSKSDSLAVTTTTFTVAVAGAETFTIKYPGPSAGTLTNDGGLTACQLTGNDNIVVVTGPATVVFTPATTVCPGGGGGSGGGGSAVSVGVVSPNGGESYTGGSTQNLVYSSSGSGISSVNLMLSTDGGATFPTTLASATTNSGSFQWLVPSVNTATARVKVEALGPTTSLLASDTSNADFSIVTSGGGGGGGGGASTTTTTTTTPDLSTVTGVYVPSSATALSSSIADDKMLSGTSVAPLCAVNSLIKGSGPAVYYCAINGKRYVFPNEWIFKSWYTNFNGVITIPDSTMSKIMIGGNVNYRPGVRMVKVQTDPKVYAVAKNGTLRPIESEAVARALYGTGWNTMIDDLSDAFFFSYTIGNPITMSLVGAGSI